MSETMAERLFYALLVELASGNYKPGVRFLSHRKVMSHWKVSTPTTNEALQMLRDNGILQVRERSGNYLTENFREKAILLLDYNRTAETKDAPLRKGRLLGRVIAQSNESKTIQRIAVVLTLPHGKTGVYIGMISPPALYEVASSLSVRGIFLESQRHDCQIDFYLHNGEKSFEKETLKHISATRPDGVIVIRRDRSQSYSTLMQTLLAKLIPVVVLHGPPNSTEAVSIDFNDVGMGHNAADAFIRKGHTKLGIFTTKAFTLNISDRTHGFILRAQEAGLCPQTFVAVEGGENTPEMVQMAESVLASGVTAIFSTGHELLEAALSISDLREAVRSRRIEVISCSATDRVNGLDTPVDVMRMDFEELGRSAFQVLRDCVIGNSFPKGYLLKNAATQNTL